MEFILPAGAFAEIDFLRLRYQKKRKVDLSTPPSLIGLPTFFGGTDVVARNHQITFLEKIRVVFDANLKHEEQINTPEEWAANLTASRVIIAACLFVQSQIPQIPLLKSYSALHELINSSLGITPDNDLDEEDKELCYLAANRVINSSLAAFDDANAALRKKGMEPISESDWSDFSNYVSAFEIKRVHANPYANYPITSITKPLFGAVFSYAGASIGYLSGEAVSKSTPAMTTKYQMTSFIGSTLLMAGPGPMGIALLSQVIAGKLITAFCSISLAHIMGKALGLVGQGIGIGVGVPLDVAYGLLWKTCSMIGGFYGHHRNVTTGIRIGDGAIVIGGVPIPVSSTEQIPDGIDHRVELKDDGLYLNGERVPETGDSDVMAPELLAHLEDKTRVVADVGAAAEEAVSLCAI